MNLLQVWFSHVFHTFGILWQAQTPIGTPFEHVQLYPCPDKISSICNQFMGSSAPIPITTRYQWRYHYPVRSTGTFTYDAPDKFYTFFVCVVPADGERSLILWWSLVAANGLIQVNSPHGLIHSPPLLARHPRCSARYRSPWHGAGAEPQEVVSLRVDSWHTPHRRPCAFHHLLHTCSATARMWGRGWGC